MVRGVSVVGRGRAGETAAATSFIDVEVTTATDLCRGDGPGVRGRSGARPGTMVRVFSASVAWGPCVGVFGWSFRGNCFGPCRRRLRAALQFAAMGNDDVGQGSVFGVNGHFSNPLEGFRTGDDASKDCVFGV